MNGVIKLNTEWINLNGATVIDIDGNEGVLTLNTGTKLAMQVTGSPYYGTVAVCIWHGSSLPTGSNIEGSEILYERTQGILEKSTDNIYVRGMKGEVNLTVRVIK